jgi:CysZ protein
VVPPGALPAARRRAALLSTFFSALAYPFRGVGYFLGRPGLWKYFAAAFAINVVLFGVLTWLFVHYRTDLVDWILPARWWGWVRTGLGWLITAAVAIAGLFLFTIIGNILASPFLDAMTERILRDLGEPLPPPRGPWRALLRGLVNQLLKLLIFGAVQIALLFLHLIPGIGSVLHAVLSSFAGVVFLGFEYLDYPLDARGLSVPGRFAWLARHLESSLGFGAVLFPVLLIPFVGYVLLPLSVAGACLLAHRIDSPGPNG